MFDTLVGSYRALDMALSTSRSGFCLTLTVTVYRKEDARAAADDANVLSEVEIYNVL